MLQRAAARKGWRKSTTFDTRRPVLRARVGAAESGAAPIRSHIILLNVLFDELLEHALGDRPDL
ncbi:MAG: hypothetical protein WD397_01835, partial [Wenzhouxiangellaceae bacterium]